MCGIFSILNNDELVLPHDFINSQFQKGKHRGPESSSLKSIMVKALFGFHRLAINGLNSASDQPIIISDVAVICNGEIYNYNNLYDIMGVNPTTKSDCEVIIHLYLQYGIEHTLRLLDGVFSFILVDYRLGNKASKLYVARDPYGVRPLYVMESVDKTSTSRGDNTIAFASELKQLTEICNKLNVRAIENPRRRQGSLFQFPLDFPEYETETLHVTQFQPGTYSEYSFEHKAISSWKLDIKNAVYYTMPSHTVMIRHEQFTKRAIYKNIQYYLTEAVNKRCSTTERPIACLLSGGLDSSLIAALVMEYQNWNGLPPVETYSIGLEGSVDLFHARIVADYLGTTHTEIILSEKDFLDAIPEVIYGIESYDTTSVRASIGNWLLGKYISANSDAKVIFNGDGADELMGGYLYMGHACDSLEFDKECRRLLTDIHAFDVLRSDKSISSHGLEPRTPFLDRTWTQYYLSIPPQIRFADLERGNIEKSLVRYAFSSEKGYNTFSGNPLLPDSILWRKKEAFSDGVSKTSRSLYEIIQEWADKNLADRYHIDAMPILRAHNPSISIYETLCVTNPAMHMVGQHLVPKTAEQFYYREVFETFYAGYGDIVPHFWMPKYVDAVDASARTLDLYRGEPTVPSIAPSGP